MPSLETIDRTQDAVLWEKNGTYTDDGRHEVIAAAAIKVRWESGNVETLDSFGNTIAIDATVFVTQTIGVGSILWLGAIADIASPPVDLMEVQEYKNIPSLKGRHDEKVVLLRRYNNTLPDIAS
ncbi:hypothetical protein OAG36_00560 [bacterium]|nr:hypothetical protein [bacterium]